MSFRNEIESAADALYGKIGNYFSTYSKRSEAKRQLDALVAGRIVVSLIRPYIVARYVRILRSTEYAATPGNTRRVFAILSMSTSIIVSTIESERKTIKQIGDVKNAIRKAKQLNVD